MVNKETAVFGPEQAGDGHTGSRPGELGNDFQVRSSVLQGAGTGQRRRGLAHTCLPQQGLPQLPRLLSRLRVGPFLFISSLPETLSGSGLIPVATTHSASP